MSGKGFKFITVLGGVAAVAAVVFYMSQQKPGDETPSFVETPAEETPVDEAYGPPAPDEALAPYAPPKIPDAVENIDLGGRKDLEKEFETTLNKVLKEAATAFEEYKKDRQVMADMVTDKNLSDVKLIEKNQQTMQGLATKLRERADMVLDVFKEADTKIDGVLDDVPESSRKTLAEKWDALVEEHAGAYRSYFATEEDAVSAYARLLRFYYTKRDFYEFDKELGKIVFENPADERFARKLRVQANRMARAQEMFVREIEAQ